MTAIKYKPEDYRDRDILNKLSKDKAIVSRSTKHDYYAIFSDWVSGMPFPELEEKYGLQRHVASTVVYKCIEAYHKAVNTESPRKSYKHYDRLNYNDYNLYMETCSNVGGKTRSIFAKWVKGTPIYQISKDSGISYESAINMRKKACDIYDRLKDRHEHPKHDLEQMFMDGGFKLVDSNASRVFNILTKHFGYQTQYDDILEMVADLSYDDYMKLPNAGMSNSRIFEKTKEQCQKTRVENMPINEDE